MPMNAQELIQASTYDDLMTACYGFFITHLATYWQQNLKKIHLLTIKHTPGVILKISFLFGGSVW